jgi:hypothetical protein
MSKVKFSNNDGSIRGFQVEDFQYTTVGKLILHRLLNNRDVKILITSKGNTTGTGKTTLAIILAMVINQYIPEIYGRNYEWDALEYSFVDVYEYLNKYKNGESGDILITDEMEYLADKRRSMTHENVHFSQAWQMLRYKNVITIGTAPSMANLDIRIPENTDIWINVQFPGYASVYYVTMDDFTGEIIYKRMKQVGFVESIRWNPIDDNENFQKLKEKKEEIGIPGIDEDDTEKLDKEDVKQEKKKSKKEKTKEFTLNLLRMKELGNLELSQEEIATLVDRSQQYVSKIKRTEM